MNTDKYCPWKSSLRGFLFKPGLKKSPNRHDFRSGDLILHLNGLFLTIQKKDLFKRSARLGFQVV